MFGARFKGLSLHFLYQKGNLIRIKTGLDTHLIRIQTRTPLSQYPSYDYSTFLPDLHLKSPSEIEIGELRSRREREEEEEEEEEDEECTLGWMVDIGKLTLG